jgi:hypothetical protein
MISIFWPLGGLFNILIYTRPKVSKLRRMVPTFEHYPWFIMFIVILFSGGDVPTEIDFGMYDRDRDGRNLSIHASGQPYGNDNTNGDDLDSNSRELGMTDVSNLPVPLSTGSNGDHNISSSSSYCFER